MEALLQLIPYLIIVIPLSLLTFFIARRKGRGIGWAFLTLIPGSWFFTLPYLASLPDAELLRRLERLEAANGHKG